MNANKGWGLSLLKADIHTCYLLSPAPFKVSFRACLWHTKAQGFHAQVFTTWNHIIIIWETTVSFSFLPWSSWALHRLGLLLPTPSFNSGFLNERFCIESHGFCPRSRYSLVSQESWGWVIYFFPLQLDCYFVRMDGLGRLEIKKTSHLSHVLFLWWFKYMCNKSLTPS